MPQIAKYNKRFIGVTPLKKYIKGTVSYRCNKNQIYSFEYLYMTMCSTNTKEVIKRRLLFDWVFL